MKKVKRWEIYNGDLEYAEIEHNNACGKLDRLCNTSEDCKKCFTKWLMEEVEVEAND